MKKEGNKLDELPELVEFLKANGIAEFEMERAGLEGSAASLRRAPGPDGMAPAMAIAGCGVGQGHCGGGGSSGCGGGAGACAASALRLRQRRLIRGRAHIVKSPIVGTFYESPSPGRPPL